MNNPTNLLLMTPITPLHPGVGRAPGAVDLPVQRDPIGYPMVYGSSLKGALRAQCRKKKANCREVFGGEPGEEGKPGKVLIPDLVLFAAPVPSYDHGYIYVTTPYLLRRILSIAEILSPENRPGCGEENGNLVGDIISVIKSAFDKIRNGLSPKEVIVVGIKRDGKIHIGLTEYNIKDSTTPNGFTRVVDKLSKLSPLLAKLGETGLVVADDATGRMLVEKSLMRVSRVRLTDKKTVDTRGGGLWTEEYISPGTLFVGAIIYYDKNTFDELKKTIGGCTGFLLIGGKETVGKGLVRIMLG